MTSAWDSSHAPSRRWRSGGWSIELRDDELAEIRFDGRRVLRSIRAVVRDRDWATADMVIDRVREREATLTLHVRSVGLGSSFAGVIRVVTRAEGLRIICDLESENPFQTNRSGLVVLHPHQLAGTALTVTHAHGPIEHTRFPQAISPHQPVFDISRLAWVDDGLAIDVRFAGDVFEMEDQRNWSDASFKTYSRPLGLPYPYDIRAGERVRQEISISVQVVAPRAGDSDERRIALRRGGAFPEIFVGASTAPDPPPTAATVAGGVLVEVDLGSSNWHGALDRARASGLPLDVRVILPRANVDAALAELAVVLSDADVVRAAAFDPTLHVTDAAAAAALRSAFARAGLDVPIIGGARSHFTEYNREHERIPHELDGIVIATTPLFHSLGSEQLVESVAVQRLIAEQTVTMAEGTAVHIGPITLRPRYNNVATTPQPSTTRADLAEGYGAQFTGAADPRQSSPELAAWTVASAAALAVPGVASIAWFEEWGPRGISSTYGREWPAGEAVRTLASLAGRELLTGDSPDGRLWAIGAADSHDAVILIANLHDNEQTVSLNAEGRSTTTTVPARRFVTIRL